jgi:hypothetical protein
MSRFVKHNRMVRSLERAGEVAHDPAVSEGVKLLYDDVLAAKATAFRLAHETVRTAQAAVVRANLKRQQQLAVFASPYALTRVIVLAHDPGAQLPETLKAQATDTDTLVAVSDVLSIVQLHAGEPWAEQLLADSFGTLAPAVKTALEDAIAANKALWIAQRDRADAFGPAYEAFLSFKRAVRADLGASSPHYRRLRTYTAPSPVEEAEQVEQAEEAAPDSAVVPSAKGGSAAATGEPTPVKVA